MAVTRPTGEQLVFHSSLTGDHILDDYLEACEIGGRPLYELLNDIFDGSGNIDAENFDFRVDPITGAIQFRVGVYADPADGWRDTGDYFLRVRGGWAPNTDYARTDAVTHNNTFWIAKVEHRSGGIFDESKWVMVLDESPLFQAVDDAQQAAVDAQSAVLAVTGAVNIPAQSWIADGVETTFTPALPPSSAAACLVTVDNVVQEPDVAYTLQNGSIVFATPPLAGQKITHRFLGGASPTLAGLDDVEITNPAGGQALVYNAVTGKWENSSTGGGGGNAFGVIRVTGQSDVNADGPTDILTLRAVGGISITTNPENDEITFAVSGTVASVFGRSGIVTAQAGDYNASQISVAPAGNIAATNVQAALEELDAEKPNTADVAPISHVGAGGAAHAEATPATAGFMSAADKAKLDGIPSDAEANQNAFTTVAVPGQSPVVADAKTDTLTLAAGENVTITTDPATDTITISAAGGPGGGGASSLDDLTDVAVDSPATGQTLRYNGTQFVNARLLVNDLSDAAVVTGNEGDMFAVVGGAVVNRTPAQVRALLAVEPGTNVAPQSHVGAGGAAHALASTNSAGFMSPADKTKLDSLASGSPFDIAIQVGGAPAADSAILTFIYPRSVNYADDFAGSFGKARVAATGLTQFAIRKNGVAVGIMQFAASSTEATFSTTGGAVSFSAGDTIEIVAPATPDDTLADIYLTLAGARA
jgi:hypothetical protein